ncbi:hypothetical protein FE257_009559 [Aspergillus nanangensis]|uniref:DUF7136 domain-containing protein n=1 Tax=Aspergillus nanangensis TaxID=2582783 RepID=A0AAD4CK88_ASPNN|nr:hypothetical protein FE257_009559 [Aspergillus nanangensis]
MIWRLNPQHAKLLNLRIWYTIRKDNNRTNQFLDTHDLQWVDWSNSTDPYLTYNYVSVLNTTGNWVVYWEIYWKDCDEVALVNDDGNAPREVGMISGTADTTCPDDGNAVAINLTDKVMDSPPELNSARRDTCVVTTNSTSTSTTPDLCRVSINADTMASITAERREALRNPLRALPSDRPDDCPERKKNEGAQQLAVLGVSGFLVAFGLVPGAPGTAEPDTYGRISNCVMSIVKGSGSGSIKIAYFEGYCLSRESYTFIIDAGHACDEDKDLSDYLDSNTMEATGVCVDNRQYYLAYPDGKATEFPCVRVNDVGPCVTICTDNQFSAPEGIKYISSENDYYGITTSDLVKGSVRTWIGNGRENGASVADPTNDGTLSDLMDIDVTTPGSLIIKGWDELQGAQAEEKGQLMGGRKQDAAGFPGGQEVQESY